MLFHNDQMLRAALHYPEEHVSGATKGIKKNVEKKNQQAVADNSRRL